MISGRAPRIKRKQLIKMIVNPEPLTYDSVKNILSLLRKEYDFAGYEVIGRSWTGKAVFSLSIGRKRKSAFSRRYARKRANHNITAAPIF